MGRRLLNALTVLSLMLCAAVVVLWVRSYFGRDHVLCTGDLPDGRITFLHRAYSYRGTLQLACYRATYLPAGPDPADASRPAFWKYGYYRDSRPAGLSPWWGFRLEHEGNRRTTDAYTDERFVAAGCPHWFVCLLCGLLPAARLVPRWRSRYRRRLNLCQRCGYDLRASLVRCPECGAEKPAKIAN